MTGVRVGGRSDLLDRLTQFSLERPSQFGVQLRSGCCRWPPPVVFMLPCPKLSLAWATGAGLNGSSMKHISQTIFRNVSRCAGVSAYRRCMCNAFDRRA